jgi:hypothetical protein
MSQLEEDGINCLIEYGLYLQNLSDNLDAGIWKTKDGQLIPIGDMESQHIRNCVGLIEREYAEYDMATQDILQEYLNAFRDELSKRYPLIDPAFADWE